MQVLPSTVRAQLRGRPTFEHGGALDQLLEAETAARILALAAGD